MDRSPYLAQALAGMAQQGVQARDLGPSKIAQHSASILGQAPAQPVVGKSQPSAPPAPQAGMTAPSMGALPMAALTPMQGMGPAASLPQDRVTYQPSALADGNAPPEYIIPSWLRDGTAADDPGARTYLHVPEAMNPYLQPRPWIDAAERATAEATAARNMAQAPQIARLLGGG